MSEAHFPFFLPRVTANKIIKYSCERFDAGTEGTWATRKHRSFLIHAVAAAAARALFSALATESRNRRARCLAAVGQAGP